MGDLTTNVVLNTEDILRFESGKEVCRNQHVAKEPIPFLTWLGHVAVLLVMGVETCP